MPDAIDYLHPDLPANLARVTMRVIDATAATLEGYGFLVDDPANCKMCFRFDGRQGLYIHPNVWHEGVFAVAGTQRFFDQQGAVHARVSVDFAREFGCLLEAPIA